MFRLRDGGDSSRDGAKKAAQLFIRAFVHPARNIFARRRSGYYVSSTRSNVCKHRARCLPITERRETRWVPPAAEIRHVCSISPSFCRSCAIVCAMHHPDACTHASRRHHPLWRSLSFTQRAGARRSRRADLASSRAIPDGAASSSGRARLHSRAASCFINSRRHPVSLATRCTLTARTIFHEKALVPAGPAGEVARAISDFVRSAARGDHVLVRSARMRIYSSNQTRHFPPSEIGFSLR